MLIKSVAHFFIMMCHKLNLCHLRNGIHIDMAQIHTPAIVTFANQKGGVGKTTLCACFANYLVSKGVFVRVIDCDRQQSITRCRKRDIDRYGSSNLPYPVIGHRIPDRDSIRNIIKDIYESIDSEIVLFDCPGSMSDSWMIPLIANSDIIVIPFHFDDVTIASTSEFILFVEKINASLHKESPSRLFMIPNVTDKRVGKYDELRKWNEVRDKYELHGTITPKISRRADMERLSTVCDLEKQFPIVQPVFDKIYIDMYGNLNPVREPIQTLRSRDLIDKANSSKGESENNNNNEQ